MSLSSSAPWYNFYGNTPKTLQYPKKSIFELVKEAADKYPKYIAYEFQGKTTTYAQFIERIELTAKALIAAGVKKGDKVTICMPNTPQGVDMLYACNRMGAIANMIHPLSAAGEIEFYLNFSESKYILTVDAFYYKVESILPNLKSPCKIIVARIQDELSLPLHIGYSLTKGRKIKKLPLKRDNYILWNEFIANGRKLNPTLPKDASRYDECCAILYSGGTTGTTKGILLTNLNFNALGLQTIAASGYYPDISGMKMLSVMPLFHGFGLGIGIHTALIGGCTCILVPQFNVNTYADLLIKKKPNFIPGVPTLFEALLRADKLEKADLSFLRGVFSGGDCLSIELKKKVDRFLSEHHSPVQIREGYGTTECVTASCLTPFDMYREGSIGVPFPDTFYQIVKPGTTEECAPNIDGEICISGPTVMLGYLNNPEETEQTLQRHSDGRIWLHTGDLGFMDRDGFIYFRQRIKRMIITSGYNVYPSQVENIIDSHPKVLLSCVVGVKDSYKMQKIKAYVVPKPGNEPSDQLKQELLDYLRLKVAKYAMPYELEFRLELPKTLVGKVAYRILEEEANEQEEARLKAEREAASEQE